MLDFLKTISAKRPALPDKPAVRVREWVPTLRRLIWRTGPALARGPWGPERSRYLWAAIGPE